MKNRNIPLRNFVMLVFLLALFSGDNNNGLVWLFLGNCLPLRQYLETLLKQESRLGEFTTLLPGHGPDMTSGFIRYQVKCVKGILDGTLERKPYQSFAGNAQIATFGKASVAFNPENLRFSFVSS